MPLAIDWTELPQQTVIGLSSGGLWALLALAIVLIYRSTGVINFAQGEMAMFSTFIAWSLINHGLSYWEAFFLTLAISFAGGIAIERDVIRPVERAPVLTIVIVTIGLLFVVDGADHDRGRRVLDPGPRQHRGLARRRRAPRAALPLHEGRPRSPCDRG